MKIKRICSIDDCEKPLHNVTHGWCEMHYRRWYAHGDPNIDKKKTHNDYRSAEYRTLKNMKERCHSPKHVSYRYYGERGITVSEEWFGRDGYSKFLEHVGRRPSDKHTIDRIDNNKNYEPGNVRWATYSEQNKNRRPFKRSVRSKAKGR